MEYCKKLTKEYLKSMGIQKVTEDGKVYGKIYKENNQLLPVRVNNSGQWIIVRPFIDENGNKIKIYCDPKRPYYYTYKNTSIPLPRLIYAWFNGEAPEGKVVSNINGDKSDNRLCNLELITNKESKNKNRTFYRVKKVKRLKSLTYYETEIAWRENYYETAKATKDAKWAHDLRCEIANLRAIRTYAELVLMLGLDSTLLAKFTRLKKIPVDMYNTLINMPDGNNDSIEDLEELMGGEE